MDAVVPFEQGVESSNRDLETLGGKGRNLIELCSAGFPVPAGCVVPTGVYLEYVERTGIQATLDELRHVDPDAPDEVSDVAARIRTVIEETEMPPDIAASIRAAYRDLGANYVAVRSSATAEDLPDASFAGQQETYLDVDSAEGVVERVRDCWASLFTDRAVAYRAEQDIPIEELAIAVVIQEMIEATKSGVIFTADPDTGADTITIEAAWGLGEAVVSGETSPDNYTIDKSTGDVRARDVNTQTHQRRRDPAAGETVLAEVDPERASAQVLSEDEIDRLVEVACRVEDHYGRPQDIEFAIREGVVYLLQTRPITTIDGDAAPRDDQVDGEAILTGLDASGGVASGSVCFDPIRAVKQADDRNVILVRETTSPKDLPGMKAASGIVTNKGGTTSHAAIVARELDTPAVVGCEGLRIDQDGRRAEVGPLTIAEGDEVVVDGTNGHVRKVT